MKRFFVALTILSLLCVQSYAVDEDVVVWEKIYKDANSDEQRVAVILKIMELKNRDFTPVLVNGLDKIVNTSFDTGSSTQKYSRNMLTRLLVQELGNLKSAEASESLFRVYEDNKDAVIVADAAVALGKIRAVQYADRFAHDLSSINIGVVSSISRDQEIIALGLVQSLGTMRANAGYEPVFLAANGWYSSASKVKDTAMSLLLVMVDDPSESIKSIIENNPLFNIKIAALDALLASKAPNEKKTEIAAIALKMAIERSASDVSTRAAVSTLRVNSLAALASLNDKTPEHVPMYIEIIKTDKKNDATLDETLKAYVALGVNGSDDAARYLSTTLAGFSDKEMSKANTVRDKSLIRQVITSMVLTKNPIVKNALVQAQFVDYDANILNLIKDALTKM